MGREGSNKQGAGTRRVMQTARKQSPQPRSVIRASKKKYQQQKRAERF